MRKVGFILLLCFCIAVVCGLVMRQLHPPDNEPQYNGKTLSYWLSHPGSVPRAQREAAVVAIGTNAIPYLVKWICAEDGPVEDKMTAVASRIPNAPFHASSAFGRNMMGTEGFRILGPIAKPAVPALMEILNGNDPRFKGRAGLALWSIDPEAAEKGGWVSGSPGGR